MYKSKDTFLYSVVPTFAGRTSRAAWSYSVVLFVVLAAQSFPLTAFSRGAFPGELYDGPGGATCEYYNRDAQVAWKNRLGDWIDHNGTLQGFQAFSTVTLGHIPAGNQVEWDVSSLLPNEPNDDGPEQLAILLKTDDGTSGNTTFFSREALDDTIQPRLILTAPSGASTALAPIADTMLHCSTVRSLGQEQFLKVGGQTHSLLYFRGPSGSFSSARHAVLRLTVAKIPDRIVTIGVFRLDPPMPSRGSIRRDGIASIYIDDIGISSDPEVIMASGFEQQELTAEWGSQNPRGAYEFVQHDLQRKFVPLSGRALRVQIAAGQNLGLDLSFAFKQQIGYEPEEIYFRYYLRLAEDWAPTLDGGKLPGLSSTYGRAGWGGRKSDGMSGWSLRGQFLRKPDGKNPLHDYTPIGTYAYHADMIDKWGDSWPWTQGYVGLLKRNQWYALEQYVKLNTPGKNDGVLRAWVDGILALERSNIRLRDGAEIKIEKVWMNIYHGGKAPAPKTMHLFIDNVVVARRYIGPITERKDH